MDPEPTGDTSAFDASIDRISALMGDTASADQTDMAPVPAAADTQPAPAEVQALEVPKSWPKEMHEHWGATPRQVQEYWGTREKQMLDGLTQYKMDAEFARNFRQAINPYAQTLKNLNVDEMTAVKQLFQADHLLRSSQAAEKQEYFKRLAQNYGIDLSGFAQQANQQPVDPRFHALETRLQRAETELEQRARLEQEARYQEASKEVEAFAADKKNVYFAEVQDDVISELNRAKAAGIKLSLQDAYDRAVKTNKVTWEKEKARIEAEYDAKLKENARLTALPKKRAASVNVKSSDSDRSPTEPLGTLEESIKATHRAIKERVH